KKFNVINYHLCHKDRFAVLSLKGACLDTACNTNLRAFPAILCCVFSRFAPYLAANEIRILIALMIPEGPVYRQCERCHGIAILCVFQLHIFCHATNQLDIVHFNYTIIILLLSRIFVYLTLLNNFLFVILLFWIVYFF